jgi:hypothetical protein
MMPGRGEAMKVNMAVVAVLAFSAAAYGQAAEQAPSVQVQPTQPPAAQTPEQKTVPQQPPRRFMLLPTWPADKPAPVIPIPTEIKPQQAREVSSPNPQVISTTTPPSENK